VIADDATIASLHERYLDDPTPTDVLAFDLSEPEHADEGIDGEIIISADAARRLARTLNVPVSEEALRYVIHGMLHLCGMRDATPAGRRRMRREEDRVLALLRGTSVPLRSRRQTGARRRQTQPGRSVKRRR